DNEAPEITLVGVDPVTIVEGNSYVDQGATASDNVDGDITANIATFNPVDVNTPDSYTVTYDVTDAAGNPAPQVTRTVDVITAGDAVQNKSDLVIDMELPKAVETSVTAPLKNAAKLLSDNNPNNDGAACGKLKAFSKEIDAKERKGELTTAQAGLLRDEVTAIQESLGCT
ncbi:MAG: DUF5011 domain-containing protein, partial [Dehalococcoidia bacterium]